MAGNKYLKIDTNGNQAEEASIQTSAGAGDAGKIPALDATGRLDTTMMPVGIGADTASVATSEDLAAGDIVNIYDNGGTPTARKADASAASAGKIGVGFVLAATTAPNNATVYFEGQITGLTGLTPGTVYFLSGATPGALTATPPTTAGYALQKIGMAISTTMLAFEPSDVVIRA